MELNKKILFFLIIILVGITLGSIIRIEYRLNTLNKVEIKEPTNTHIYSQPLTISNVEEYILALNLEHPEIVLAQCKLESNHLKSKNVIENHNLFGMTIANQRPTTAKKIDPKSKYAYYATWEDSVLDYALWQAIYARNKTKEEYFLILSDSYATNPNYVNILKSIIK